MDARAQTTVPSGKIPVHANSNVPSPTFTRLSHDKVEAAPQVHPLGRVCQNAHDICTRRRQQRGVEREEENATKCKNKIKNAARRWT